MKLVSESLNESNKKKIEISAGLVIIQNNKILLVHATNSSWESGYGIPKGGVEKKEDILEAARRETKEEIGIKIKRKDISTDAGFVDYTRKGKVYKRVYYFVARPIEPIILDIDKLQKEEIDWAGFLSLKEAEVKIFWRFRDLLKFLDN